MKPLGGRQFIFLLCYKYIYSHTYTLHLLELGRHPEQGEDVQSVVGDVLGWVVGVGGHAIWLQQYP